MYDSLTYALFSTGKKKTIITREASDTQEGISAVWIVFWIAVVTLF